MPKLVTAARTRALLAAAVAVLAAVATLIVALPSAQAAPGPLQPLNLPGVCNSASLALAQAIGRWGNWANQEAFGTPSDLPWAVEIEPGRRPDKYAASESFHPTFLYESLYCAALGCALIWIDHRFQLKKFQLFALYCMGYTAARFVFEEMRIDPAHTLGPLRINAWVCVVVFIAADGLPTFIPPPWVDPEQKPQRNLYHRRE